ncbi:hypothetical protein QEJ31_12085 [Pigmentibacter sp. JX0631]|nr:hypothetical protein [Pigmentibacter sp. JX0631]WGL59261.1 hypothetical protein QEJ31_12085 [Pigmentibacter sp. JX0631]
MIDKAITPNKILWIDPDFCAGVFGKKWFRAPSNTSVLALRNIL